MRQRIVRITAWVTREERDHLYFLMARDGLSQSRTIAGRVMADAGDDVVSAGADYSRMVRQGRRMVLERSGGRGR